MNIVFFPYYLLYEFLGSFQYVTFTIYRFLSRRDGFKVISCYLYQKIISNIEELTMTFFCCNLSKVKINISYKHTYFLAILFETKIYNLILSYYFIKPALGKTEKIIFIALPSTS